MLIPFVQNKAGDIISHRLSEDIGTEVTIGNVRFHPIKKIILNDLLIKDQNKDSLLYINKCSAPIDSIIFSSHKVFLGEISISKLQTSIVVDSKNNNYSFILDSLQQKDISESKWEYNFKAIKIKNSSLVFQGENTSEVLTRFNSNNLNISKLNLHIDQIEKNNNDFSFRIKSLSAQEKSGFSIRKTKGTLKFGKNGFLMSDLMLSSKHSFISIAKFKVDYDSTFQKSDFINKSKLQLQVNSLAADARELSLFIAGFPKLNNRINLRGNFIGTIADLKGRNISINAGSKSEIETNFDIQGLPNFKETYLYLNVKKLNTNINDIAKLTSLNNGSNSVDLPDSFKEIGDIEYSGNFTGFIDNLVAYGNFKTNLGVIKTDIGIKLTEKDKLVYSGFVNTESFNIGKIINSDNNLNKVTMDVSVQGYKKGKDEFNSFIKGTIDSIDIKGYKYEKIELNGLVSNKKFDGRIKLDDPNAKLLFNGKVDFSQSIPEFDFDATLTDIRLDKLNITPNLYGSLLQLNLKSKLTGNSINTLSGTTVFHDGQINVGDNEYKLDSLTIQAHQGGDYKEILVNSDLIDSQLAGNYNLNTIKNTFKQVLSKSIPALFASNNTSSYQDQFTFSIKTKRTSDLCEALESQLVISDGSQFTGEVNGAFNQFQLNAQFDNIKYKTLVAKDLLVDINSTDNKLTTSINSSLIGIDNLIPLNNFSINQHAFNDSINLDLNWNDLEEFPNRGNISTITKVKRTTDNKTFARIELMPSFIAIKDSIWKIQDSEINITPNGFRVNTFRVHHLNQEININGSLYKDKSGSLTSYFQNINLKEVTSLFNIKRLTFDGLLNGSIELKNNLKQPIITSDISVNNFEINEEEIGNVILRSNWSNLQKAVLVNAQIKKGSISPLNGIGYFKPSSKDFNFNFKLDSLPLGFINMYTSKVLQNFKGTGSGNLELVKTKHGVGLNGGVKVNKAKFDVDLLKCSFFVEDSVKFTPDTIIFDYMTVTDAKGQQGIFDGSIKHTNFNQMYFDLYIGANNMLLLNTKVNDNPLYYGTVYASGDLAITGSTYDLNLDLNGTTERNTRFFIPISDDEESLDNNFIRFVSYDDSLKNISISNEEEYKIDLSNYSLNMGVEVTPDAEVQVIFDPALGNTLRSWGRGNLQIQRNKEGKVSFLGDYVADRGDYIFSLENVVNKRFDINKGGTVIWEGNPYDALIDITATYKLKTSLQPLSRVTSASATNEITGRVPVNCDLILSNRLSQPKINFNITAPTLEQSTQNIIQEAISTDEELNRQVLSLLVLNKFYTPSYNAASGDANTVNSANLANTYTYELLSGQLSNLVSQMIDDVDVGISYRPEDEISSEQIEVALSTQIFNDRVTLNGNVEYGKYGKLNSSTNPNSSNIVGDFDLDVKLNKSGSLRAKAYTHSNDDFSYDNSPTTQGVGISYQEEFDTVGELLRKYWNWIIGKGKKEDEPKVQTEKENSIAENEQSSDK